MKKSSLKWSVLGITGGLFLATLPMMSLSCNKNNNNNTNDNSNDNAILENQVLKPIQDLKASQFGWDDDFSATNYKNDINSRWIFENRKKLFSNPEILSSTLDISEVYTSVQDKSELKIYFNFIYEGQLIKHLIKISEFNQGQDLTYTINNIEENLKKITIDNYKDYFENANNLPNTRNIGKLTIEKLAELMQVDSSAIKSFTFKKSDIEDEKGYVNVNINIELNKGFIYGNTKSINLENIKTGMFDPNSEYNLKYLNIRNVSMSDRPLKKQNVFINLKSEYMNGEDIDIEQFSVIYVPNNVTYLGYPATNESILPNFVKRLDFRFSSAIVFSTHSAFRDNQYIEEITFNGLETFTNKDEGQDANNTLRDIKSLKKVDFSNTPIEIITQGMLQGNNNLTTVLFENATKLKEIRYEAFKDDYSLEVLDFSDSPITIVNDSAFIGCSNLKTIYVKDETSKQAFENSLKASNLTNCQVIIKNK